MASGNTDRPRGFIAVKTTHGGPPKRTPYYNTGTAVIYRGDAVKKGTGGQVASATADTDLIFGVAAEFNDAADTTDSAEVMIYDDLENTIFEAQCADSTVAGDTMINLFYDINIGTATTTLDSSVMEVATGGSVQDTILVIGRVVKPKNNYGKWVDVYCKFHVNPNASVIIHTSS